MQITDSQEYLAAFEVALNGKAPGTTAAYLRAVRAFMAWVADKPGSYGQFHSDNFTRTSFETYMAHLSCKGYSVSYRTLVKSAVSSFAGWLIEQGYLQHNPTRGISIPAQPLLAPRILAPNQRYVLRNLVEREQSFRPYFCAKGAQFYS